MPGAILRIGNANARDIVDWMKRVQDSQNVEWGSGEEGEESTPPYAAAQSIFGKQDATRAIKVPKPNGARAFEVIGIPLGKPGFYVVELASPKLGAALLAVDNKAKQKPVYHVSASALVTNLAVHLKRGRESSLVWVTTLDAGVPVDKAQVSVQDCSGKEHWKGTTDARGIARIGVALPSERELPGCMRDYDRQYMVFARAGNDMSFVHVRLERRDLIAGASICRARVIPVLTSPRPCSTARWCVPAKRCT